MSTDSLSNAPPVSLPTQVRPSVEHLTTEDDTPVDNLFSEKQQRLLTEPLYTSWASLGETRPFIAMANVGLFYAVEQPPIVPDMLLSLNVQCPVDLWPKQHRSYFMWEYGKPPDAVIEIVSNRKGGEDTDKLATYSGIRIPYYAIYDLDRLLSDVPLRVFRLEGMNYVEMEDPSWLPDVGLKLQVWQGTFEGHNNRWLRWADEQGNPIPTGAERSEQERNRAEQEHDRAEKLADQLRQLGIEPDA